MSNTLKDSGVITGALIVSAGIAFIVFSFLIYLQRGFEVSSICAGAIFAIVFNKMYHDNMSKSKAGVTKP